MSTKVLLCLALMFIGRLFAAELETNSQPQALPSLWKRINYPWPNAPRFLIGSGEQWNQVSRGLRLDIMSIQQGFRFFKTNAITARLYRANGEIVEPTTEGRKLLNSPVSTSWAARLPDGEYAAQVITYFPWSTNALEEAWIAITVGPERYWLEIPYGFDRNPADPLPPAVPGGPPKFVPSIKSLAEHDHLVRWQSVHYTLGRTQDGCELSLVQSNPFDAKTEVEFYTDRGARNVYSPHTDVRIIDADGTFQGKCVGLRLDDNHLRRTDTFSFGRYGGGLRCWGRVEVDVDGKTFGATVPSSLYKYTHGHCYEPPFDKVVYLPKN